MSHFYHNGNGTGDRICNAVCEYKSISGYCTLTTCIKQFDQYLNMNIDTSSFADCVFCKYDLEKEDVLYKRTICSHGMEFEEVTVYYCPVCGRKL